MGSNAPHLLKEIFGIPLNKLPKKKQFNWWHQEIKISFFLINRFSYATKKYFIDLKTIRKDVVSAWGEITNTCPPSPKQSVASNSTHFPCSESSIHAFRWIHSRLQTWVRRYSEGVRKYTMGVTATSAIHCRNRVIKSK